MQIPLDPTPCLVAGAHDSSQRRGEFVLALRVGDRSCQELGEPLHPLLGILSQPSPSDSRDRAPEVSLDHDRCRHLGGDAEVARHLGDLSAARGPVVAVDARRPSGAIDLRGRHPVGQLQACADRRTGLLRDTRDDDRTPFLVEPCNGRHGTHRHSNLLRDGREDLLRQTPLRHVVAMRRRAACSAASVASASRESAFAIAVATMSVKRSSRASVSGASDREVETVIAPHSFPSTTSGLATADLMWSESPVAAVCACEYTAPSSTSPSPASTRAERPVLNTPVDAYPSTNSDRMPIADDRMLSPVPTMISAGGSCSNLTTAAASAPSSASTSREAAEKIAAGGIPCATSVATRWSEACSSACRRSSS